MAWPGAVSLLLLGAISGGVCAATSTTLQVSASIVAGCVISNPGGLYGNLNFGTYAALSTAPVSVALTGGVTLQCTPGVTLSMTVDGGLHNVENQQVIGFAQGVLKCLFAIGKPINIEPRLGESLLQIDAYFWFVFSNKKSHRWRARLR